MNHTRLTLLRTVAELSRADTSRLPREFRTEAADMLRRVRMAVLADDDAGSWELMAALLRKAATIYGGADRRAVAVAVAVSLDSVASRCDATARTVA